MQLVLGLSFRSEGSQEKSELDKAKTKANPTKNEELDYERITECAELE